MKLHSIDASEFVETPVGIFTRSGNWYYTTSDQLNKVAPGLLGKVPLVELLEKADIWVRSTDSVSLWIFAGMIHLLPMPYAVLVSALALFLWHLTKSAFVSSPTTVLVRILSFDALVLTASVISISYLGILEMYYELAVALLFFMIFRFGWLRRAFDKFYNSRNPGITLNDRVMKMLVIRTAMSNDVEIQRLKSMEEDILALMKKHKKKK